jgi:hypothetical protein
MRFIVFQALALLCGSAAGLTITKHQAGEAAGLVNAALELRDPSFNYDNVPISGQVPIINIINTYRHNRGIQLLAWDSQLTQRSSITGIEDVVSHWNGPVHDLKPPSLAQVITAGIDDQGVCSRDIKPFTPFQLAFLAWVCENPSDPAIHANCDEASDISHIKAPAGDTGHWEILSNPYYNRIGCAFTQHTQGKPCDIWTGYWVCDLGKA